MKMRLLSKDEVVSTGNLDTVGECATAIKAHVDTCNGYRDLWLKVAAILVGYIISVSVFVGATLMGHDDRITAVENAQLADRKAAADAVQAAFKEIGSIQVADRAAWNAALAADRQRMTDTIAVVTNSQIERTKQAVSVMDSNSALMRDELKSVREEIERLRAKIETLVTQRR